LQGEATSLTYILARAYLLRLFDRQIGLTRRIEAKSGSGVRIDVAKTDAEFVPIFYPSELTQPDLRWSRIA
jgi:hypothetical protein